MFQAAEDSINEFGRKRNLDRAVEVELERIKQKCDVQYQVDVKKYYLEDIKKGVGRDKLRDARFDMEKPNDQNMNVQKIMIDTVGIRKRKKVKRGENSPDPMFDDEGDSAYDSQHDYEFVFDARP